MSFLNKFISFIQQEHLFQKNDRLLLAVSGGIDSVVLCELCYQWGFIFEIAHCNFRLRGEESERDEAFVKSLEERYNTRVWIKKFDTENYAQNQGVSIQVAARELRYQWFDELMHPDSKENLENPLIIDHPNFKPGSNVMSTFLLTAHHANDNIETLLMNFFKGTGIKGLRGILPKQGKIIRPLLFAKKEEIISFARENNLPFVEDSSNLSDKYTRNYFRNHLIPAVKKVFPRAEDNLLENIERFRDIQILYDEGILLHKKKLLEYKGKEVHIPVLKLLKSQPLKTIIYEIIKDFGFTVAQTDEVIHLLESGSGKYISSPGYKIIKDRKWLIIVPQNTMETSIIIIEEKDKEKEYANGKLLFEKATFENEAIPKDPTIAFLDADMLQFPLLLRKWKLGDYFYPLGMQKTPGGRPGKKKLSRFFIDLKLSLAEKENTWVIESNKKITWIVGKRIDDRCKVTANTKNLYKIFFKAY